MAHAPSHSSFHGVVVGNGLRSKTGDALVLRERTRAGIIGWAQPILRHLVEVDDEWQAASVASHVCQLKHHIVADLLLKIEVPLLYHRNRRVILLEAYALTVIGIRSRWSALITSIDRNALHSLEVCIAAVIQRHDRVDVIGGIGLVAAGAASLPDSRVVPVGVPLVGIDTEPTAQCGRRINLVREANSRIPVVVPRRFSSFTAVGSVLLSRFAMSVPLR